MECTALTTELVCRLSGGVQSQVIAHYEYGPAADGGVQLHATRYTDADGNIITPLVGDVFTPGMCTPAVEFDAVVLCDPAASMAKVVVVITYSPTGVPTTHAYTVAGAPWPGDVSTLVQCEGPEVTSQPEPMCDNGATTFLRWYVTEDGDPTGVYFDTTTAGAPYVPVGTVTFGSCGSTGLATEATLLTRATEATQLLLARETTLASVLTSLNLRALESTQLLLARETTLATRASEVTLASRATEATLLTRATEATLLAILAALNAGSPPATAVIASGGVMIAGAGAAATAAYAGLLAAWNTATAPVLSKYTSITITALGVTNGFVSTSKIAVTLSNGTVVNILNGETKTWSVARPTDDRLAIPISVAASGMAVASIHYTGVV